MRLSLPNSKIQLEHLQYLTTFLQHSPDVYLLEMRDQLEHMCGVSVSISTVWRTLKTLGFTCKKLSKRALERNGERRLQYTIQMGLNYEANQLVFVDESSFDRRTSYR
ncbi:hypothetical protein GY45DRAFT_1288267, partial [Cubamyces sp. BRFM 1775]